MLGIIIKNFIRMVTQHVKGISIRFRHGPLENMYRGTAGISTLCFAFPAAVSFYRRKLVIGFWWCIQTVVAFTADFIYAGKVSVFHGIDRIAASGTMFYLLRRVLSFQQHQLDIEKKTIKNLHRDNITSKLDQNDLSVSFTDSQWFYILTSFPAVISKAMSYEAASRKDCYSYNFWHTNWHVFGAPYAAVIERCAK